MSTHVPQVKLEPTRIAEARHLYEETDTPVLAIARNLNLTAFQFQVLAKTEGWRTRTGRKKPGYRKILAQRIERAVARKIAQIEKQMGEEFDVEKSAKALATLARTLRELNDMEASHDRRLTIHGDADDLPPRDPEALREELARRLKALQKNKPQ